MTAKRYFCRLAPSALFLLLGITAGCSNSECLDNKNSLPLAGFYSSAEKPQAISIDSLTIEGIDVPGDSILHDSVRSLSSTYLPFRIDKPQTSYRIRYLGGTAGKLGIADNITFNYEIQPWFVSSACGAIYKYHITSIRHTSNFIDSVVVPGDIITNTPGENIRIYFRVNVAEEGGEQ
ncbi:MAG: hypothetical protein K2J48_00300 [Muribaculaceae bacterium]|nr:hypothetical protein [Muribaculaceae bacterium]